MEAHAGQVLNWDFQSDVFEGQYRLVERVSGNIWLAENLPPSEEIIDKIIETGAQHEARGFSWLGTAEEVLAEVERRQADAGRQFRIEFVSSARYHAAF